MRGRGRSVYTRLRKLSTGPLNRETIDSPQGRTYPCRLSNGPAFQWPAMFGTTRCNRFPGQIDETHISAKQRQTSTHSWIPCPYGNQGRPQGHKPATGKRPRPADTLDLFHQGGCFTLGTSREFGLAGDRRLTSSAQITRVFRRGKKRSDKLFTVVVCTNDTGYCRCGLAISIKATGGAVNRNRVKRLVREKFRRKSVDLPGVDVVFVSQPAIRDAVNADISASLDWHFDKLSKHARNSPVTD